MLEKRQMFTHEGKHQSEWLQDKKEMILHVRHKQAVHDCLLLAHSQRTVEKNEITENNNGIHVRIFLTHFADILSGWCAKSL